MSAYRMIVREEGGPEALTREDFDPGQPGEGEVLLRHTAIGLNFLDTYFRSGLYPWPPGAEKVPGGEAAGVVEAVGAGVDLKEGERVCYTLPVGAYASHRVVVADKLIRLPEGVSDEVAAAATLKGLTVHYLLERTFPVGPDHVVLFHAGAGGVGTLAGQWLNEIGCTSIATAGGPEKCQMAKDAGYGHVIDYNDRDVAEEVARITDGAKCHVVYDGVGKDTWTGSLDSLRRLGMMVSFGNASGPVPTVEVKDLASRGGLFFTRPSLFNYMATREELERGGEALFPRIADGRLKVDVRHRWPLADAAEAHRALEGRETTGSGVLLP